MIGSVRTTSKVVPLLLVAALVTMGAPVSAAERASGGAGASGRILVKFAPGASASEKAAARTLAGSQRVGDVDALGVEVLAVPAQRSARSLEALAKNPNVIYAESDGPTQVDATTPNDRWWPDQWSARKVSLPLAWDLTTGSTSTVVAVLDTGVDASHPELAGKVVDGIDIINSDSDASDDHGHGTKSAGVIAALSNNGSGLASACWKCKIMPVKVMGADGHGYMSSLAAGIVWATDHGAKVISMSLSGKIGTETVRDAVRYAHSRNVVLVASAGNSGANTAIYPAAYPQVIAVAGTTKADTRFTWSNYGGWVDVAAPGCNYTTGLDNWMGYFCGTSSAAPLVAGVAGLAFSHDPHTTSRAVKSAIESTAITVGSFVEDGRIDAKGALAALGTPDAAPAGTVSSPTP